MDEKAPMYGSVPTSYTAVQVTPNPPAAEAARSTVAYLNLAEDLPSASFQEVFPEGFGTTAPEFMSELNYKIYNATRNFFYTFLVVIVGPFAVFGFALFMASMSFMYTYLVAPALNLSFIAMLFFCKFYRAFIRLFFDPCFESLSLTLSNIRATFDIKQTQSQIRTV
eukprot:m.222089 g.222089  ORF g.222089 m.222089 type:complete len:167 (+) comp10710_c0_seq1:58-558(+)